jgi:hypothetical protein
MKSKSAAAVATARYSSLVHLIRTRPKSSEPTPEEIARLAHSYWEDRGCQGGSPEEDWFRAENELKAQRAADGE